MRQKILYRDAYVVGEKVDENNHLWYIVEENTENGLIIIDEDSEKVNITIQPDQNLMYKEKNIQ